MNPLQYITRHTLLLLLFPNRYIDPDHEALEDFNMDDWAATKYEWRRDPLWGLLDHASPIGETIETGRGDCVDYGLVAASYLARDNRPVYFGVSFGPMADLPLLRRISFPRHFVVSDGQRLYESTYNWGEIGDYLQFREEYDNVYLWKVRSGYQE